MGAAGQQSRDAPWDAGGPGTPHHTHGSPDATAGSPGMSAVKRRGERTGRPRHVPGPAGHPRGPDPQPHALGLAGWPSLQPSPAAQPSPAPPEHRPREQSGRVSTPGRAPPAPPPPARSRARAVYPGTAEHTEGPCCVRQPTLPAWLPSRPPAPPAAAAWPPEAGPRGHASTGRPAASGAVWEQATVPRMGEGGRDVSGFVFATALQAKPSSVREAVAPPLGAQLSSHQVPRRTVLRPVSAPSQDPSRLPRPHTVLVRHTHS